MKVYIVEASECEDHFNIGVFLCKAVAEKRMAVVKADDTWYEYAVVEYDVDETGAAK